MNQTVLQAMRPYKSTAALHYCRRFVIMLGGIIMVQKHSPRSNLASTKMIAEKVLQHNAGMARTRDFEDAGIGRWHLPGLIRMGLIEKVGHGLYRSTATPYSANMELAQACIAVPKGVIFLASALAYYGLTTFNPPKIWVARCV